MVITMHIIQTAKLSVNPQNRFQRIDGFGVNINAKYWGMGTLRPVVDHLIDDLGATLFRLDAYGKANWPDPDDTRGSASLQRENLDRIYQTPPFQNARSLALYLNERGIAPYITISGIAPAFLCAADRKTLTDFEGYAKMAVDYAAWLRREGVHFTLFGPLNETDYGPPEGPSLSPEAYAACCEAIVRALDAAGLCDVNLVIAEQGDHHTPFLQALLPNEALRGRIAVCGMHNYWDLSMEDLVRYQQKTAPQAHFWMTEFGDLCQSAEREDEISFAVFRRLCRLLQDGMQGALFWDAFDNYHDHDEQWTTYGLLRAGLSVYMPKKRYYALKHIYRYVRPGFFRIGAECSDKRIPVLAFTDEKSGKLTLVGCNPTNEAIYLDFDLALRGSKVAKYRTFEVYRTQEYEDCARVTAHEIKLDNRDCTGLCFLALPGSIFTVSDV